MKTFLVFLVIFLVSYAVTTMIAGPLFYDPDDITDIDHDRYKDDRHGAE